MEVEAHPHRRSVWVLGALVAAGVAGAATWRQTRDLEPKPPTAASTNREHRASPATTPLPYGPEERHALLTLARTSLVDTVLRGRMPDLPDGLSSRLLEKKGCFVTLTIEGRLRGCIGHIFPEQPLAQAVIENARSAAVRDSRFSPVAADELDQIAIEVSVLSVPEPLDFSSPDDLLGKLRPGRDGVVLDVDGHRSTFLPQVWEQLPDPMTFLDHLSAKAGVVPSAWRGREVRVQVYQVQALEESELGAKHEN